MSIDRGPSSTYMNSGGDRESWVETSVSSPATGPFRRRYLSTSRGCRRCVGCRPTGKCCPCRSVMSRRHVRDPGSFTTTRPRSLNEMCIGTNLALAPFHRAHLSGQRRRHPGPHSLDLDHRHRSQPIVQSIQQSRLAQSGRADPFGEHQAPGDQRVPC